MAQALSSSSALVAKMAACKVTCTRSGGSAPVALAGFSGRQVATSTTATRQATALLASRRVAVAATRAVNPVFAMRAVEGEAEAKLNGVRGSPLKVRRVVDQIRGRSYEEALMILEFMPYRACDNVLKVLYSAAANAKNNKGMSKAKLYVKAVTVDGGPVLKRFRPRAQGRGFPIRKPTCSIHIIVAEREGEEEKAAEPVAVAETAPAL